MLSIGGSWRSACGNHINHVCMAEALDRTPRSRRVTTTVPFNHSVLDVHYHKSAGRANEAAHTTALHCTNIDATPLSTHEERSSFGCVYGWLAPPSHHLDQSSSTCSAAIARPPALKHARRACLRPPRMRVTGGPAPPVSKIGRGRCPTRAWARGRRGCPWACTPAQGCAPTC